MSIFAIARIVNASVSVVSCNLHVVSQKAKREINLILEQHMLKDSIFCYKMLNILKSLNAIIIIFSHPWIFY